jgi:YVTN family beta-propeller protein
MRSSAGRYLLLAIGALALGPSACSRGAEPDAAPSSAVSVFVSNETAGTVAMVDPATGAVQHVVAVGKRPRGLKLSRDGRQLLVALSGSPIAPPGVDESTLPPPDRAADGIGVVDLSTRTLVRTYPSGQDPESFDVSLDGKKLYVSNEETAEMSVLDMATGTIVARVPVGEEPEGVTLRPDGRAVYVTCEADSTVVAIDTATHAVIARVPTAKRPRSIVFTPDGATMFVTGETGNAVSVVDVATHTVTSNILGESVADAGPPRPMGAVLSPDGRELFVSNGRGRSVSVIDVATRRLARTFADVGTRPWGIGISPDGQTVYTANGPSGDLSVVDAASGRVIRRIALGGSPWGVAVAPAR